MTACSRSWLVVMVDWVRADTTRCHLLLNTWGQGGEGTENRKRRKQEGGRGRAEGEAYLPAPLLHRVKVLPAPRQPHMALVPHVPQGRREGAGQRGVLTSK